MIAGLSALWHLGIALLFSTERVHLAYRRLRCPVDVACGALLIALGIRLAADPIH